ncbi:MAG: abortive infection system antitoxin AbiGi family protein [Acidobacteriota bacterium]
MEQRYASTELTHFTGSGQQGSEEKIFETLTQIVKSGRLTGRPDVDPTDKFYKARLKMGIRNGNWYVCFCDIPVADLALHAAKYSRFGLSFRKEFIIQQGGTPVFYMATSKPSLLNKISEELEWLAPESPEFYENATQDDVDDPDYQRRLALKWIFRQRFLAYAKPFDPLLGDEQRENYYLEREWRLLGDLQFRLDQVERVFLPREYAREFHKRVTEYPGQLTFIGIKGHPTLNG